MLPLWGGAWYLRWVPLHTEIQTTNMGQANQFQDHNECHASTPDGRLYLCGEKKKFLRYFKFESMTFTDDGVPIWNDGSWNLWPSQLDMKDMNKAAFCYPDWHRPFEVLSNGDHFYATYVFSSLRRQWVNITVRNPMTREAEVVNVAIGPEEMVRVQNRDQLPQYGFFALDGKIFVGTDVPWWKSGMKNLTYVALPETEAPCSLQWPEPRFLHEMHADPDGLQLPTRYPVAKYPLVDPYGAAYTAENPVQGMYMWSDQEFRNLWYKGYSKYFRVIGEDTGGIEVLLDGAMNIDKGHARYMTSAIWNFESERTPVQRFPGELHTSGVGSGAGYQLPMSKGHHVLPCFAAWDQYYAEPNLYDVWKSPHWDILFLPMTPIMTFNDVERFTPDISHHFLTAELLGDATIVTNGTADVPTKVQGVGSSVEVNRKGVVKVELSSATSAVPVPGITSPVKAFTAQITARTTWKLKNGQPRWVIHHQDLKMTWFKDEILWTLKDFEVHGGNYEKGTWVHLAMVFDGTDRTISTYNNGELVITVQVPFTTLQLAASTMLLGHYKTENWDEGLDEAAPFRIDNFRLMAHARSQRNVCKSAMGSQVCDGQISYHPTSSQYELSMQLKECTAASLHTCGCYAAIHRVCANLVAMKQKESGVSNDLLGALTPPGPPVSMAGVPVALNADASMVSVACNPFEAHLSVPVDWRVMTMYNQQCLSTTDHSTPALPCTMAAHIFCKEEMQSPNATGIIFEVDARAWITCFETFGVIKLQQNQLQACGEISSIGCQFEVAAACRRANFDGGLIQSMTAVEVTVHCFNAPASVGVHDFHF